MSPLPARHVRPLSTIRGALVVGFAVVFGLWVVSAYELDRSLTAVEQRVADARESFFRGEQALSTVRSNVLLGSLYVRDTLIDPGAIARDFYRGEIQQIRAEIEQQLPAYVLEVQLPIERQHWAALQTRLDQYWASLDVAFAPDLPSSVNQSAQLLRRQVIPARNEVLSVIETLAALQQLARQRHEIEASALYGEVRQRFLQNAVGAILLGLAVACFAFWHVRRLEREIERQRVAEADNRRDLERLSARLVDVQEQERRHLARELHDEVGQALTAIKMDIGVALRQLGDDPRARSTLDEARQIAERTLQSVRELSQLLHPSMLDDFGLPEALDAYLRGTSQRTGIRMKFTHEGLTGRLPVDVEICVYRIVQEAVTNVVRHSGARTCMVSIAHRDDVLRIAIDDDGKGLSAKQAAGMQRGLGLIAMRERAQALAGRLSIENRPEGGVRVLVTLPVLSAVLVEA